tara:strand:+ start:33890 stop:34336 length:447 start_codon:yes stop_codon:yes gene_type:complete
MTTGTDIVQKALKKIGAHSIAAPAASETVVEGADALNSMLQTWTSQGIVLGIVPLDAPGDELGEPNDATNAIISNLALELAPNFDNGKLVVSPTLEKNAKRDYNAVKNLYQVCTIPDKVVSSTLPRGAGNKYPLFDDTYFNKGDTVNG